MVVEEGAGATEVGASVVGGTTGATGAGSVVSGASVPDRSLGATTVLSVSGGPGAGCSASGLVSTKSPATVVTVDKGAIVLEVENVLDVVDVLELVVEGALVVVDWDTTVQAGR